MKFTILSHAGMLVESRGTKLVSDPWLFGSCYWRSWWNFPRPPPVDARFDGLDYVYLTHHHWDHFHGPSLRKLPRTARVLIPKAHSTFLLDDVKTFPFKEVIELPHGKPFELAPGFTATSYHFGMSLDSTLVLDDGERVLMNMNDCKITGSPLRQVMRRHPKVDFLFRSHSSAAAYPHCVDAEDPAELTFRQNEDYLTEFVRSAALVKPRYAVPFASNHCFLHKETFHYNSTAVSPVDVKRHFDAAKPPGSECVVMVAGDSWDDERGFDVHGTDAFEHKEKYLADYLAEMTPKLEAQYEKEDRAKVDFAKFEEYFAELLRDMPPFSRRVFRPVVAFQHAGAPGRSWVVDFGRRRVYERDGLPEAWNLVITTHPFILRDCLQRRMFAVFFPSKRLRIRMAKGSVRDLFILMQLLEMHEYGYFPLRKTMNRRFLGAWARRWRELLHTGRIGAKVVFSGKDKGVTAAVPRIE